MELPPEHTVLTLFNKSPQGHRPLLAPDRTALLPRLVVFRRATRAA